MVSTFITRKNTALCVVLQPVPGAGGGLARHRALGRAAAAEGHHRARPGGTRGTRKTAGAGR